MAESFVWKIHGLFYLNYPQINEVRKSNHMINIVRDVARTKNKAFMEASWGCTVKKYVKIRKRRNWSVWECILTELHTMLKSRTSRGLHCSFNAPVSNILLRVESTELTLKTVKTKRKPSCITALHCIARSISTTDSSTVMQKAANRNKVLGTFIVVPSACQR